MDRLWAQGTLAPRWAESFYTGYGAPVFHYYASFSYYVATTLMRIFSLDPVNALRGIIILSVALSATGMYGFMRPMSSRLGGMLAAVTYVYSPYLLFTEPYSRGVYPELLAFALFPIILWVYSRLKESLSPGRLVVAAVMSALLVITHNLMALVLTGVLFTWLLWQIGFSSVRRGSLWGLVALLMGVLLSAGFWLPVALEGSAVKLGNLTGVAELNYRNFFVPFADLFATNPRLDGGAFNGLEHQLNLGLPQWLLALASVLGMVILLLRKAVDHATRVLWVNSSFFALVALGCILLISTSGESLWSIITPLAYLQFPWRLLGSAVLALAILVGMNVHWITHLSQGIQIIVSTTLLLFIIGSAAPLLYIPEWIHAEIDTSVSAYHQAEVQGLQRATTFSNEYLPAPVEVEPGATPRLLADYADGYPINKAHLEALPEGVTVEALIHTPTLDRWRITTTEPFTFEVLTFAWLGWQARIDGLAVPITPSSPHGLITLPVPAGTHEVEVYLGDTPARSVAALISLGTGVGLVGVLMWGRRRRWAVVDPTAAQPTDDIALWAGGAACIITLIALPFILREGVGWVVSAPGEARLAQQQTDYRLNETLRLIGYDVNATAFRPGDRLELTVYWYASAPIPYGYASFVHVSTGGPPLAQADKLNPAGIPTKTWPTTGFIQDHYAIVLPSEMPPGTYQITVGLYTCDTLPVGECGNGERMQVTDGAGLPLGDSVTLAEIHIP
jgi:hypothetical protein